MVKSFVTLSFLIAGLTAQARPAQHGGVNVIYGDDDRIEAFQLQDPQMQAVAASTVGFFKKDSLVPGAASFVLKAPMYGQRLGLCTDEPFYKQPSAAFCSGFLIAPDLVATAGHCIEESTCSGILMAFGFEMNPNQTPVMKFPSTNVYSCKKVIARELTSNQDYAVVQLDRPVSNRTPLTLARRAPQANEALYVIGHPAGLPKKVAGGANVRRLEQGFFVANTDTYGGNSGSAVFSQKTHEVLGILVRGENDFVQSNGNCKRSFRCTFDQCRGEDITFIEYVVRAASTVRQLPRTSPRLRR